MAFAVVLHPAAPANHVTFPVKLALVTMLLPVVLMIPVLLPVILVTGRAPV